MRPFKPNDLVWYFRHEASRVAQKIPGVVMGATDKTVLVQYKTFREPERIVRARLANVEHRSEDIKKPPVPLEF